ncbi:unknown (plasmid) [Crocosphaera subtropica ATCC 51142]|uniref:MobA/MobL protein domain-containing protein n=1 Tax=Crocosphaera subtropica (strain ATCC 51142 / BH68) TaxID=43989 RepID=B1X3B9_CROS5|nr:MobQ family relaxase [Crocosphaera subtropica]ACB54630.1 unknown [Crocosphaera subtropica ATCC 51142]
MAIYHLNAKIISRSNGQSATEAAAYRAAEKIHDLRIGETFNYTRKKGVYATEILTPHNAPNWMADRSQLWNAAELFEKRSNSRTAREFDIALPTELTHPQKQELVRNFAQDNFVDKGLVADLAFHEINTHNPHVHIMITTRIVDENGLGAKDRSLDKKDFLLKLRESWATYTNDALESIGSSEKIDHRSLKEQNISRIPQIHLGANVAAMMKRGIATERGDEYLEIKTTNEQIEALEKQLVTVENSIKSETLLIQNSSAKNSSLLTVDADADIDKTTLELSQNLTTHRINNDGDERERSEDSEADLTAELRRINEAVIESNRQADENRQRLQDLSNRLGNDGRKTRKSRKSTQQKRPTSSSKSQTSSEQFNLPDKRTERKLSSHLEGSTVRETGNQKTPRQRDNVPSPNSPKIDRTDSDNLQSRNLDVNQTPSPQQSPTGENQRTSQQHRNQAQSNGEKQSLTPEQRQQDFNNVIVVSTAIRLMRYVKAKPKNGFSTYEGKRYIFKLSTDKQTMELHAKDGRGLIFERKDGKVTANLTDEDRKMIHDVDSQISQRIAQLQRDFEQREKQRCRGRGFSR